MKMHPKSSHFHYQTASYRPLTKSICRFLFFTFAIWLFHNFAFSQPTQEWVKIFSGFNNSGCRSIAMGIDPQGNIYSGGRIDFLTPNYNIDYALVKYNSLGVQQWAVYYNNHDSVADYLTEIAVDSSGNIYLTGYSGYNFGPYEFLTVKYNTNGVFQWARTYGSGIQTRSVIVDKQQNIIVTGGATIKYTPAGDTVWVRIFNEPPRTASGLIVRCDDSNNVYIGGTSSVPGSQNDFHIVKYNSNGIQLWWAFYNGPMFNSIDIAEDIAIDKRFGSVILTGESRNGSITNYDFATIKYNSAGTFQWVRRYDGPSGSDDYARAVILDSLSNIYITGSSYNTNFDFLTIKYFPNGDTSWIRRYNGTGNSFDDAYAIATDKNSNIFIFGRSINSNNGFDNTTVKYTKDGIYKWNARYPGTPNGNSRNSIFVNNSTDIFVLGQNSEINSIDCITIKYSDPVGIVLNQNITPVNFNLYQNYPNPFNPSTKIKFSVPKTSLIQLEIYDVLGRIKEIPVNEKLIPSEYEMTLDGTNYSSGVYFYQLTADGYIVDTKKFVIIK